MADVSVLEKLEAVSKMAAELEGNKKNSRETRQIGVVLQEIAEVCRSQEERLRIVEGVAAGTYRVVNK